MLFGRDPFTAFLIELLCLLFIYVAVASVTLLFELRVRAAVRMPIWHFYVSACLSLMLLCTAIRLSGVLWIAIPCLIFAVLFAAISFCDLNWRIRYFYDGFYYRNIFRREKYFYYTDVKTIMELKTGVVLVIFVSRRFPAVIMLEALRGEFFIKYCRSRIGKKGD